MAQLPPPSHHTYRSRGLCGFLLPQPITCTILLLPAGAAKVEECSWRQIQTTDQWGDQ